MASLPLTLCLLTAASLAHSLSDNPLLDRAISDARLLFPRRGRGGSGGSYYKTCEESYGTGYADCYGSCYNAGAGEKCCDGNYSCSNGEYCGYGAYSYCCFDYQTPQECSSGYDIAQPPANWKPGDGNAPASITDPATPTYSTPTETSTPQQTTSAAILPSPTFPTSLSLPSNTYTPFQYSSLSSVSVPSFTPFSFTAPTFTFSSLTVPNLTLPTISVPTADAVGAGGVRGGGGGVVAGGDSADTGGSGANAAAATGPLMAGAQSLGGGVPWKALVAGLMFVVVGMGRIWL